MARPVGLAVAVLLAAVLAEGCKRGEPSNGAVADGAAGSGTAPGPTGASDPSKAEGASAGLGESSGAIFSLPIAGARVTGPANVANGTGVSVIAAGLSVASHTVSAVGIDGAGKVAWTRAAIPDVAWSADAELHAWPIGAGAALVWRGPVGKKSAHVAVVLAPDGHVIDGPLEVGSLVCATDDGLAWSEETSDKATRVRLRTYSTPPAPPRDDTGPGTTEDFTLTCGAHRAYAVVEGDEGTPTKVFAVGGAADESGSGGGTIAPMAFGRDEERDLFPWADGDDLGFVRVASGGEVQAAAFHAGAVSLIHADKARIAPEDDVVGVDADARQVVLVTTHDESDACPDGSGSSIHALRIARHAGGSATSVRIAPSVCGKDVGPFWTNTFRRSVMVAWAERASRREKSGPPITALAFRALEEGASTSRIAQSADGLADAGCDESRCYAVALAREPGGDGTKPEAIKVIAYP